MGGGGTLKTELCDMEHETRVYDCDYHANCAVHSAREPLGLRRIKVRAKTPIRDISACETSMVGHRRAPNSSGASARVPRARRARKPHRYP